MESGKRGCLAWSEPGCGRKVRKCYSAGRRAGKNDLIVALDFSGRGFYTLWIYNHGSGNNLVIQQIRGWKMKGGLKAMLQDLNGDGMDELIVLRAVGQEGAWTPTTAEAVWAQIYRPESGKYVEAISRLPGVRPGPHSVEISTRYVEASRDFPRYYNTILSNIDRSISMLQQRAARGEGDSGALANALVLKYKIIRVLGRDPTAGLSQASQWMNSDDPEVLQCALATFYDIGGHEKEVRTIRKRLPGVIARAIEARKGE
jgi:hypothetical protein